MTIVNLTKPYSIIVKKVNFFNHEEREKKKLLQNPKLAWTNVSNYAL